MSRNTQLSYFDDESEDYGYGPSPDIGRSSQVGGGCYLLINWVVLYLLPSIDDPNPYFEVLTA